MTEKMIDNRCRKLQAIEAQIRELQTQAEALKTEIQSEMTAAGTDEMKTAAFTIRWKEITRNCFDCKSFKTAMPELFAQYSRQSVSRRFTVA